SNGRRHEVDFMDDPVIVDRFAMEFVPFRSGVGLSAFVGRMIDSCLCGDAFNCAIIAAVSLSSAASTPCAPPATEAATTAHAMIRCIFATFDCECTVILHDLAGR